MQDESTFQATLLLLLRAIYFAACHGQILHDDKPCTICKSTDHQAQYCENNAFNLLDKEMKRCGTARASKYDPMEEQQPGL